MTILLQYSLNTKLLHLKIGQILHVDKTGFLRPSRIFGIIVTLTMAGLIGRLGTAPNKPIIGSCR